jgi:predicted DNA-binding transcriptional regulator YafY
MTAREISGRLEVSERTVYRDIEALGMAGVPVYAERGPGGGCALVDGYRTQVPGMTESEVQTLFVAGAGGPLKDLGLGQALDTALRKVLASLPAARRELVAHARQRVFIDPAGWSRPDDPLPCLGILQDAIWQDRCVELTYQHSEQAPTLRRVAPYGLVAKTSVWYLVAAQVDGALRTFRVSRVRAARILDETFERVASFDLADYWAHSTANFTSAWDRYQVTFRVNPDFIPALPIFFGERVQQQVHQAQPDEHGRITVTVLLESFDAARSRMLSLGTQVEVLEPLELRRGMRDCLREMQALYA